MEDKELLEKIIAKQSVIIPAMEKTGETKDIPEKLRHAMAAAEEWADVIEKKEGRDKEARRWPVKQFAEEAHEHIALFDHETRQQIQEYCELVARLPYDDDAPLGVKGASARTPSSCLNPAPSRRAGLASSRRARPCPRRCGRS